MITDIEYRRVVREAGVIAEEIGSRLNLRPSQRQSLYNMLVSAASSETLREHLEDYVLSAKGWERS